MTGTAWQDRSSADHPGHLLHASAVAYAGHGCVIAGPSGVGKSSMALQLMALGAALIGDDAIWVTPAEDGLVAQAADGSAHAIEARGLGILPAQTALGPIDYAIELLPEPGPRLPPGEKVMLCGRSIPLYRSAATPWLAAGIFQILKGING